jgi:hypothetical protein
MRIRFSCLTLVAVLISGCMSFRSTEGPMNSVKNTLQCTRSPETLLVFLPGAYDIPQDFIAQGFVKTVRDRNVKADIEIVDAHAGYYKQRQILNRLKVEVIEPAKAKGYTRIWLVGISLGGYGALLYAMHQPLEIEGFFLMAPYMGPSGIAADIASQGGLKQWSPKARGNVDVDLWEWLKGYANNMPGLPKAYLGFGSSDRFEKPNNLFAKILPASQRFVVPGGHDWETWRKLWVGFLDASRLPIIEPASDGCGAG